MVDYLKNKDPMDRPLIQKFPGSETISIEIDSGCEVWPSDTAQQIVSEILPVAIRRFLQKNKDYGDAGDDLGLPGQYSEIHRKMGKLRKAMWEGKILTDEPVEEVLKDMLGHILLAMHYVKSNNNGGKF